MYLDATICNQCLESLNELTDIPMAVFSLSGQLLSCTVPELQELAITLFQAQELNTHAHSATLAPCYTAQGEPFCTILFMQSPIEAYLISAAKAIFSLSYECRTLQEQPQYDYSERISFLYQLLHHSDEQDEELTSFAAHLKIKASLVRCAILFDIANQNTDARHSQSDIERRLHRLAREAPGYCEDDICEFISQDKYVVLKTVSSKNILAVEPELFAFAHHITQKLTPYLENSLYVGVGTPRLEIGQLKQSYEEACFAVNNYPLLNKADDLCFVHQNIYEYLSSLLPQPYLNKKFGYFTNQLDGHSTISETISILSKNHNNLLQSAQELNLHRNTMLQRYNKLKDVLHVAPLQKDADRMQLRQYALYRNRAVTLHAGIIIQSSSILHEACQRFAALLFQKSNGAIKLTIHTVSLTGNNFYLLDILKSGSIDFAVMDIDPIIPYTNGNASVLNIPFLFDNHEQAQAVLTSNDVLHELFSPMERHGLINLGIWSMGWRYLSSQRPIRLPADLKGAHIRVMQKPIVAEYFSLLGARTQHLNFSSILTALKQGIVEMQENPYSNFVDMKLYEAQSHLLELNYLLSTNSLVSTMQTKNKLTPEHWRTVCETARAVTSEQYADAMRINEESRHQLDIISRINIHHPTSNEIELWKSSAKPLYDSFPNQHILKIIQDENQRWNRLHPNQI